MHPGDGEQPLPATSGRAPGGVEPVGAPVETGRTGELCDRCVQLLPVDGAAVTIRGSLLSKELLHATDAVIARLDDVQFVIGEGPCRDAYRLRTPVLDADLTGPAASERWPGFTREALAVGAAAVFAFPLQIGAVPFGVLELYRATPGGLTQEQLVTALLLADTAAHSVMDDFTHSRLFPATGPDERDGELDVPQATGMLAAQHGISVQEALAELRAAAFAQNRPLREIARAVLDGRGLAEQ